MSARWQSEVERPWVGMTDEAMTDVEQARAELMDNLATLKADVSMAVLRQQVLEQAKRRLAAVRDHPASLVIAAGAAAVVVVLTQIRRRNHRPVRAVPVRVVPVRPAAHPSMLRR